MTAKEYLKSQLSDPCPEASSVQIRTALCAYAMKINAEVDGYSLNELEKLIRECGIGDKKFIEVCSIFVSNTKEAFQYISRIPNLDD